MKKTYFEFRTRNIFIGATILSIAALAQDQPTPKIETYGVPETLSPSGEAVPLDIPAAASEAASPTPSSDPGSTGELQNGGTVNAVTGETLPSAPVVAPVEAPKTPDPDEGVLKGINLGLNVSVYPIGFNNQTVGETNPSEQPRWYFQIQPGVSLSTAFKTEGGTKIDFSTGYTFAYSEYFRKTQNSRDFNHAVEGSMGIEWNPIFSTTFPVGFEYAIKSGTDEEVDAGIVILTSPTLGFKVNKQLSFSLAYDFTYFEATSDFVSIFDINSGGGTAVDPSGDILLDDASLDGDLFGPGSDLPSPRERWVFGLHKLIPGVKYAFNTTTLALKYHYALKQFSNKDSQEWTGHFFVPSVSQKLPTKGTVTIGDELRLRKYSFSKVSDGSARQNFRNRLYIKGTQPITDKITYEIYYRWQISGENKDNYEDTPSRHWFYTGVTFTL